jgi:peptidylprolyl isomerase
VKLRPLQGRSDQWNIENMKKLVRINDEVITSDEFIKLLRLTGRFDSLMDEIVKQKLTVHAARLAGLKVSAEAIQEYANQFRRERGLYRAVDMNRFLDAMDLTLAEFETYVSESLLYAEMNSRIESDEAVQEYFRLNSPLLIRAINSSNENGLVR